MGTDDNDLAGTGTVTNVRSFKVHHLMCTELMRLVDRITRILPEIEAARPRCQSGIHALCSLNKSVEKSRLILQYCSESSKLYLAVTGEVILSRCTKSRGLLKQSLFAIQDMVPVMLAAEISHTIDDLSAATFVLDPYEEAAGKVMRELLQKDSSDSPETTQLQSFQLATSMLQVTTSKAILIEKRSIKNLLDKIVETDPTKKKILTFFLYLFKKYGKLIVVDQPESIPGSYHSAFSFENSGTGSYDNNQSAQPALDRPRQYKMENNMLKRAMPLEEFRCPISSRLMYDPVVISSGQTYERMWIQKWFDEGNVTCPKTGMKLSHFSLTPNDNMKDMISRWCTHNGIVILDPRTEETPRSWDTSCTSIASFGSSMNDLHLHMDFSNVSIGSIDTSFSSDCSRTKVFNGFGSLADKFQTYENIPKTNLEFLSNLGELTWESRCKVVADMKGSLAGYEKAYYSLTSENFIKPLIAFLKDARDLNDVNALMDGFHLLTAFASKNRNGIPYLRSDAFDLLASLLDSEVAEQVLTVFEILSGYPYCRSNITGSGALVSILGALDSETEGCREKALKILYNLSTNNDICSEIASFLCIPKLVPLIQIEGLTRNCLLVMKNLCNTEEGRSSVAETRGCVASIAEVLEIGTHEEQEHAVDILLLLCSQRIEYCQLVMNEGVIPSLVSLSVNGNDRAKASALELLRQLRDVRDEPERPVIDLEAARAMSNLTTEKKTPRSSGFFGRKISLFGRKR